MSLPFCCFSWSATCCVASNEILNIYSLLKAVEQFPVKWIRNIQSHYLYCWRVEMFSIQLLVHKSGSESIKRASSYHFHDLPFSPLPGSKQRNNIRLSFSVSVRSATDISPNYRENVLLNRNWVGVSDSFHYSKKLNNSFCLKSLNQFTLRRFVLKTPPDNSLTPPHLLVEAKDEVRLQGRAGAAQVTQGRAGGRAVLVDLWRASDYVWK